jgi:hypothetical protein
MSGVYRNIDPPPPHRPASVYPPDFGAGGGHTRWVVRGSKVWKTPDTLYCTCICKYFVVERIRLIENNSKCRYLKKNDL